MTISGLLGKGVTPTEPVSRYEMSIPSVTGDPEIFHYMQRGAYAHGHGGGKASWKGSHSAMSALTLLAFLFFIHLLQTCIQESMMPTGPTMLMMVAANRSGPLSRPSREIHQYEGSDINALPGPGVYWDKNFLIRLKGDPGVSSSRSEQKHTDSLESNGEANAGSNTLTDHDAQFSAIYDDHEDRALFSKAFQLKSNKHYSETGEEISAYSNSFFHKQLGTSGNELTQQKDISLSNSGYPSYDTNLTSTGTDPDDTKYYQENNNYEFNAYSRPSWDSYDEYDSTQYTSSVVTDEPSDEGHKSDKYELDLYHIINLGNYTWRTVTSVYNQLRSSHLGNYAWRAVTSVYNQLRSSFSVVQCYELVVCETHRVGRAWGDSGMLLASGLSEIMMWLYGEDDDHRRLITEAATTGRQRQSCVVQMQQCEDKSRDKSVLPTMARLLEKIF